MLEEQNNQQEKCMSIGNKFLSRVTGRINKAEEHDGVNDGFNIPLDRHSTVEEENTRFSHLSALIEGKPPLKYWVCTHDRQAIEGGFDTKEEADIARKRLEKEDDDVYRVRQGRVYGNGDRTVVEEGLAEAADVGNDDFASAVVGLVSALGVPDDILERRRTQIVQAIRQKKAKLRNRAQIMTLMTRLSDLLKTNEVKNNEPAD